MKLSTKCRYGIRAIIEIARNYKKKPTKRKDISKNQNINDSYLENILIDLKHAGIVMSIRGAKGGFALKHSPARLTIYDIVNALQASFSPVECLDTPSVCERISNCLTRPVWSEMKKAQEDVLKKFTIKKLLEQESEKKLHNYCI